MAVTTDKASRALAGANVITDVEESRVAMKRDLGLVGATSIVVGMIIGSGIFISPKNVLQATGSVGLCLVIWVVAGIAQLGTALCFAELGAMIPRYGGAYTYIRMGLGNPLAFVYVLQLVTVIAPSSTVIVLLTFGKYTVTLLPVCGSPVYLEKFIAATVLVGLALVNVYSSRLSGYISVLTMFGKISALLVIILGGLVAIARGTTSELGLAFSGTSQEPISLALAMYGASYSYGGGENLNLVAEEIKNPTKTLPRAAILGMLMVVVIYVLTNVAYLAVMTRAELLDSPAVAVLFADRVLGAAATLIPVAVLVSTFGTANNSIFSRSRLVYAAARDGNFPEVLSYVQVKQLTPLGGMTLMVTVTLILLAPADVTTLMNYIGFLGAFFHGCVYVCLIRFRLQTMRDAQRPIKIPLVIPVLMLLLSLYLFVAPLAISPDLRYVYVAAGVFGVAACLYLPFVHFRLSLPYYDKLVTWTQLVFEVCPPTKIE
ncbi:hypothetical protein BsWGS_10947 [Bradybaena similaris]